MFRYAYKRDYGSTPEQDIERVNQAIDANVIQPVVVPIKEGLEISGDVIQAIPDPVLSGAGFIAGGVAVVGTGGTAAVATGVGYVVMGTSIIKSTIDYSEGEKGAWETGTNIGLEVGGNLPVAGHLIDGGAFLYDTIKYNYNNGNKINLNTNEED